MILEQSEDEKKKQLEQQKQNDPFTPLTVGAGGRATSQSNPPGAAPNVSRLSPTTPQTPTQSFGTVQDYLKGSKEQGERFGEQFVGNLEDTYQQHQGTIDQAAFGTQQDIDANILEFDQDLITTAVEDPTKITDDEDQFTNFLDQWNAEYTGPTSFEGSDQYDQAITAGQAAQETGEQLASTGGRQQLISDEFGVYGRGKKGLDEALLQHSSFFPETQEQAKGFQTIQDYIDQHSETLGTEAQTAKQSTEDTKRRTREAFTGNLAKFQTYINTLTADAQEKAANAIEKYIDNITSGTPDTVKADLEQAGVDPDVIEQIVADLFTLREQYGVTPDVSNEYFRNPVSTITPGNIASKEDYADATAYQKLTGHDYSGVLNPADIEQAGTGASPIGSFKDKNLQDYLNSSVGVQDKSLLDATPTLDSNAISSGKFTSQDGKNQVKDIVAAGKRQNIDPKDNNALQSLEASAMQGIRAAAPGSWRTPNVPPIKTYADIAVASMMAKGKSKYDAQKYTNDWFDGLFRESDRDRPNDKYEIYDMSQMSSRGG